PILKYCSSCHSNKSANLFEANKKSCLLYLNWLNEGYKRKREEQYVDDIYDMQKKVIESEKVKDIVYQESIDVEEGGQINLKVVINFSSMINEDTSVLAFEI
ncbi:28795_t:CDS:1, partial [Racocetra persica]